jgi:hypothetical protein
MPAAVLGNFKASFRFDPTSAPYLRIAREDGKPHDHDADPPPKPQAAPPVRDKRPRSVSAKGTGRGTGRGGKPAAARLTRPLKAHGKRSDFIRFIGGRTVTMDQVRERFPAMSIANVNGYLINIWKDHGIGYEKEGGTVRLLLPKNILWSNVWGR